MKLNCICSFSGSDKAPSELLHFYTGVDCVWKLFLGFFSFLFFFKPPQICNAASFISKLLSPPPQILLPLLVPLLQWGTAFRTCDFLSEGQRCIVRSLLYLFVSCAEGTRASLTCLLASSSCLVAFCSSKPRASAWPAVSSCNCLTVSISRCLQGGSTQTTISYWHFRAGMPGRWHMLVVKTHIKNHIQLLHTAVPQDAAPGT